MIPHKSKLKKKDILVDDNIQFLQKKSILKKSEKNKYKVKKDLYSNLCIIPMNESSGYLQRFEEILR